MAFDSDLAVNMMLRGGAMLLLLLIAVSLWRDYPRNAVARLGALFSLGVAAFALESAPGFAAQPSWWHAPIVALDFSNMLVFWLFTQALLNDGFALRIWHVAAWSAFAAVGVLTVLVWVPSHQQIGEIACSAHTAINITLAALCMVQALTTWRGDLVEGRRRLRMIIVAAIGAYSIVMTFAALLSETIGPVFSSTANALGLAVLSVLIVRRILRVDGGDLFQTATANVVEPEPPTNAPLAAQFEKPDPAAIRALEHMMQSEQVYRDENLSIGALAIRMDMPEYKLRRLINQGMGFRNFNAFLNAYRIEEAKRALGDRNKGDVQVLSIAMDAGFQSLGPFNRAFKTITGLTPSEFRRNSVTNPE